MTKLKKGDKIRFKRKLTVPRSGLPFTRTFEKDATAIVKAYSSPFLYIIYKGIVYRLNSEKIKWIEKV